MVSSWLESLDWLRPNGSDPWFYFQYNERWQQVAMWRGTNTSPTEVFIYRNAGLDGYGGSSYVDDVILRERDDDNDGDLDTRLYYLQNWRHDVSVLMTHDGIIKEKVVYDAYGRPHSFSPADISDGTNNRPGGSVTSADATAWSTGSAAWNKDIGNSSQVAKPDGVVSNGTTNTDDSATITGLIGYTGGWNLLGESATGNRKGFAGYEFDPVLNGAGTADNKVLYHVRHRALAADTGKWLQKDPLGYHDSMDLYEYCGGDPLDAGDPMGLCSSIGACAASCLSYQSAESTLFAAQAGCLACLLAPPPADLICFAGCIFALDAARANLRAACITLQACECTTFGAVSTRCDNNGVWPAGCRQPTLFPLPRHPDANLGGCGGSDTSWQFCIRTPGNFEYERRLLDRESCLRCCRQLLGDPVGCCYRAVGYRREGEYNKQQYLYCVNKAHARYRRCTEKCFELAPASNPATTNSLDLEDFKEAYGHKCIGCNK